MKIHKSSLSHDFLVPLAHIPDPPKKIWHQGTLPEGSSQKVVSIVGSRKNTKYGEEIAYRLACDLAKQGVVVVSGMAYGIDSCAHRGCLDGGGTTVAVLGTNIDRIYPARNTQLAKRILEKGAIISEYGPDAQTGPWSFLERNRIVSGLADVLVIVEAAARSGTLSTAAHALDQGKTVFAVPGDITRPMSFGCNRLIKQGAIPFTDSEDIANILFPGQTKKLKIDVFGDTVEEQAIIDMIKQGCRDGEAIIDQTGLSVSEFNQAVTLMEINGTLKSLGGNKWALV